MPPFFAPTGLRNKAQGWPQPEGLGLPWEQDTPPGLP